MIKNDLFLRILQGEKTERPAVWMMRQAGRYLPEFRALRAKYDFFTRCRTPELVAEITTQPVDIVGVDAAILFSDILVVPQAMGIHIEMKEQVGPYLPHPIRTKADIDHVQIPDVTEALGYVMEGIRLTKERLAGEVPLIGFAGAPWTIFCYAVEGKGSKNFDQAKSFAFSYPEWTAELLQKITDTTIAYLREKVKAGVDALQLFDSWGGVLSGEDYQKYSWPYTRQIVEALSQEVPVIVFAKGCWYALEEMSQSSGSWGGLDLFARDGTQAHRWQESPTRQLRPCMALGTYRPDQGENPADDSRLWQRTLYSQLRTWYPPRSTRGACPCFCRGR